MFPLSLLRHVSSKSSKALEIGLRLTASYMITEVDGAKGPSGTPPFRRLPEGPAALPWAWHAGAGPGQSGACSETEDTRTPAGVHLELPWLLTEREVL